MATRPNDKGFEDLRNILARVEEVEQADLRFGDQLEELAYRLRKKGILYGEAVREFKRRFILTVLEANGGNQCHAAREMEMHRNTLSRTIDQLGLITATNHMTRRKKPRRAGIVPGQESKVIS